VYSKRGKKFKNINLKLQFFTFVYKHVRHTEPDWTCSRARFTLVANRTVNAFTFHWTGLVEITTVPNRTEPGPVKITP